MSERSQSDVIGTVLMTLIVTVTVTGAGGVALSEFQSDLGGDPIADIDSELTHDSIAIEHFGGDELNTTETVVQLNGDDVVVPLAAFDGAANQLAGGMRVETDEFESTTGDVSLQVVHKPSQTVVHSETYNIQLLLLVEGETGPVFMVEEPPINYTAADGAELTVSDETIIDVDEEQSTIDGLQTGKTAITANSDETQTVNLTVIEPDQLAIDTLDVETNGVDLEVDGELTALGELDETALYIQYKKQRPVSFNGDPDDAGDNIIADGQFLTGPDGYTHDEGRIRDEAPLIPGENRTYEYLSPPEIYSYVAYISDEDGRIDRDWTDEFPEDGRYNVTVEYTADGSTINVYIPETTDDLSIDVSGSEEVYFTTDENNDGGNIGADSLRLITAYGPGKPQYDQIESGVESPKTYTGEISNLRPDTTYSVAAHTEREITNAVINATDVGFAIKTEGLVTTRDPTDITAESVTLRGNLTNSYGDSDVSFVLTEADGTIVSETEVATDLDTPQEFSLTVDELSPNTEYIYYAHAEDSGIEGDPATHSGENVRFTTRQPAVDTLNATPTGGTTLEVGAELVDLGRLDEMDLSVRYRKQRPVSFNGDPDDAGDNIIADGQFLTGPDGYTHDEGRIRDKAPLVPGENRTYEYLSPPEIYSYIAYISDEDGRIDRDWTDEFPEDGRYDITVEYTDDGSTLNVYIPETTDDLSVDVSGSEEVYFTTDENNGGNNIGTDSLRLITAYGPGAQQSKLISEGVSTPTQFTTEISDLYPETHYYVEAYAEETVNGQLITATDVGLATKTEGLVETRRPTAVTAESVTLRGDLINSAGDTDVSFVLAEADGTVVTETEVATGLDTPQEFETTVNELSPDTEYVYYADAEESGIEGGTATDTGENVSFTTQKPVVDTIDVTTTGGTTLDVDGELVDLGGLAEMDLSVRYSKQRPVSFNGDPDDAGDNIIADGQFLTGPDGYTHDEGRIRDKAPLIPGENRTYEYLSPAGIYSYIAYISDEDGGIGRDWTDEFPEDGRYNVTVEYTADGSTINVYIPETTDDLSVDVSGSEEVYFTTDENNGGNNIGTDSLRLITAYGPGAQQSKLISENVRNPTTFSTELSGLQSDTYYYVDTYAEETVNDQLITATDVGLANSTDL